MAEDVLKNIVGIFDLGKIKSPKLKTERTSSYIFTVYLVVEIFTLFSEVNLPMRCVPADYSLDDLLRNATLLPAIAFMDHLSILCTTQIRFQAVGFYAIRVALMLLAMVMMLLNRLYLENINILETKLEKEKEIDYEPTELEKLNANYQKKLRKLANKLLIAKLVMSIAFIGLLIPFNIISFEQIDWRTNITPEGWTCQGNLAFATDAGDVITRPLSCHIDREYAYFVLFLFIRVAQILLAIFYCVNVIYLVKYRNSLVTQKNTNHEALNTNP
jgi:hypothetical protein